MVHFTCPSKGKIDLMRLSLLSLFKRRDIVSHVLAKEEMDNGIIKGQRKYVDHNHHRVLALDCVVRVVKMAGKGAGTNNKWLKPTLTFSLGQYYYVLIYRRGPFMTSIV